MSELMLEIELFKSEISLVTVVMFCCRVDTLEERLPIFVFAVSISSPNVFIWLTQEVIAEALPFISVRKLVSWVVSACILLWQASISVCKAEKSTEPPSSIMSLKAGMVTRLKCHSSFFNFSISSYIFFIKNLLSKILLKRYHKINFHCQLFLFLDLFYKHKRKYYGYAGGDNGNSYYKKATNAVRREVFRPDKSIV